MKFTVSYSNCVERDARGERVTYDSTDEALHSISAMCRSSTLVTRPLAIQTIVGLVPGLRVFEDEAAAQRDEAVAAIEPVL
jgi:hypothetical protein